MSPGVSSTFNVQRSTIQGEGAGNDPRSNGDGSQSAEVAVEVPAGEIALQGILGLPEQPAGVVLFAHGSGSGRHSPRNTLVARTLQRAGYATLLIDLLTEAECEDRRAVFNIGLLADRLLAATEWLGHEQRTQDLPVAYFGASTGAGAALVAAARWHGVVAAIVSRGGRPDLAGDYLEQVESPTLLIVGGNDMSVIALNREALERMRAPRDLVIIPGATHLFEEPGTLEQVAQQAVDWFGRYVG